MGGLWIGTHTPKSSPRGGAPASRSRNVPTSGHIRIHWEPLVTRRRLAHTVSMATPKIAQLIAEAKAELIRLGVNIDGKRPEDLLSLMREERNKPALRRPRAERRRQEGHQVP